MALWVFGPLSWKTGAGSEDQVLLSRFAHDVKLSAACADTKAKGWDATQRNLDKPEKWALKNPM